MATGSLKNGPQSIGRSRGGLTTKVHLLALDDRRAWSFSRSAGHWHDAPEGRRLLQQSGLKHPKYLIMDRAYGTAEGGARPGSHARGAAPNDTLETLVLRPPAVCLPQRSGTPVRKAQAVSPRGDTLRQTRRHVRWIHLRSLDIRNDQELSVNTP